MADQISLRAFFPFLLLILALFSPTGCQCDGGLGVVGAPCVASSECTGELECVDGICIDPQGGGDLDGDGPGDSDGDGSGDVDGDDPGDSDSEGDGPGDSDSDGEGENDGDGESCVVEVSCESLNIQCGTISDGCGGALRCGSCPQGSYCGTGPDRGTCVASGCEPITSCVGTGRICGSIPNGCGGVVECGSCEEGLFCTASGSCESPVASCDPITDCASQGVECGVISDGCGGTLSCGGCSEGEYCGTGADAGSCVEIPACVPTGDCAAQNVECGVIPDGCGGVISCGSCGGGQVCGTGAERGLCIDSQCTPTTCAEANTNCGLLADGCSGTLNCGSCPGNEVCGTGPALGQCIAPSCVATTCADIGASCGVFPDGCGDVLNCGGCGNGEFCQAGNCESLPCAPATCDDFPTIECGPVADGCGGSLNCGSCAGGLVCGSGVDRGQCVQPPCSPLSCDDYDFINCGPVSDGCGGVTADCGSCQAPEICGGSGVPNVCGADPASDDCENFCLNQVVCPGGGATTLTGTVFAPDGELPVPNAVVYVPNVPLADLPPLGGGPECIQCEDEDLGDPLVGTVTDFDGTFELRHVPANVEFPLVIKVGDWRRVVMIPPQNPCGTTALTAEQSRLPKTRGEGSVHDNIPQIAVITGHVDAIECVLYKMGVDESEFTRHTENGAIHMYRANGGLPDGELAQLCDSRGCTSSRCTDRVPTGSNGCGGGTSGALLRENLAYNLYDDFDKMMGYDIIVMDCEATQTTRTVQRRNRLLDYLNMGGRLFASHYAYDWLHLTDELREVATWGGNSFPNNTLAYVDNAHPAGVTLWSWLGLVGALHPTSGPGGEPQVAIQDPRNYVLGLDPNLTTRYVYTVAGAPGHTSGLGNSIQQFSFDTPVFAGPGGQCGRVVYSAFHVANVLTGAGPAFPTYCGGTTLTSQEKILAYMLFDLAACVSDSGPPQPPVCTPLLCSDVNAECGTISDGCGGTVNCGPCPDGEGCGAGGLANQCSGLCTPLTCAEAGAECGIIENGCGGTTNCGPCTGNAQCGAGGTPNQCACIPLTCGDHGAECGEVSDGCGGTLDCDTCPVGQFCGVEAPNQCSCEVLSCADHGAQCGTVSDGCGGFVDCGDCPGDGQCGAGGQANQCICEPISCEDHGLDCGVIADGCGGTQDCGSCSDGQICGGAGVPNICADECVPLTCGDHGAQCGQASDGCGGTLECGDCPGEQTCGGAGVPNQCSCVALTCGDHGAECGTVSDGCGRTLDCGECPEGGTCGSATNVNMCICEPLSCEDHGAQCGEVTDGCGTTLECGDCTGRDVCENFVCITPPCRLPMESCDSSADCCTGVCSVVGGVAETVCVVQ